MGFKTGFRECLHYNSKDQETIRFCGDQFQHFKKSESYFSGGDVGGVLKDEESTEGRYWVFSDQKKNLLVTESEGSVSNYPLAVEEGRLEIGNHTYQDAGCLVWIEITRNTGVYLSQ